MNSIINDTWTFVDFLGFCLITYGITNIIVYSSIFQPIRTKLWKSPNSLLRKLGELMHCSICTGFWVGGFIGMNSSPTDNFIFDGAIGSAVSWLLYMLVWWLEWSVKNETIVKYTDD